MTAKKEQAQTEETVNTNTGAVVAAPAAPKFVPKVLKSVTRPVIKIAKGHNYYFKVLSTMHVGKKIEGDKNKEPATIMDVLDLTTGEEGIIVCPFVLVKELDVAYPEGSYVGLCFQLKLDKVPGKNYNIPTIAQIEEPV